MFKRLKYRKLYKKAILYLDKVDYSALIKYSERIQSFHINEKMEKGAFYQLPLLEKAIFHHLPLKDKDDDYLSSDNWDLSEEEKSEIHELLEKLNEYYDAIYIVRYYTPKGKFILNGNEFKYEVLPPWIVFPQYTAMSLGWRMGSGEEYMEIYLSYIDTLSDEQYEAYTNKYPTPEYMEVNSFGFNMMNHKCMMDYLQKKERR